MRPSQDVSSPRCRIQPSVSQSFSIFVEEPSKIENLLLNKPSQDMEIVVPVSRGEGSMPVEVGDHPSMPTAVGFPHDVALFLSGKCLALGVKFVSPFLKLPFPKSNVEIQTV